MNTAFHSAYGQIYTLRNAMFTSTASFLTLQLNTNTAITATGFSATYTTCTKRSMFLTCLLFILLFCALFIPAVPNIVATGTFPYIVQAVDEDIVPGFIAIPQGLFVNTRTIDSVLTYTVGVYNSTFPTFLV